MEISALQTDRLMDRRVMVFTMTIINERRAAQKEGRPFSSSYPVAIYIAFTEWRWQT
jgi:hypothetical protein